MAAAAWRRQKCGQAACLAEAGLGVKPRLGSYAWVLPHCSLPLVPPQLQADDLREENQLLHRAVQTLQAAVEAGGDLAAAAHCQAVLASIGPRKQSGAAAHGAHAADAAAQLELSAGRPPRPGRSPQTSHFSISAEGTAAAAAAAAYRRTDADDHSDTISLMSLNDGDGAESFTTADGLGAAPGVSPTAASLLVRAWLLCGGQPCRAVDSQCQLLPGKLLWARQRAPQWSPNHLLSLMPPSLHPPRPHPSPRRRATRAQRW